MGNQTKLSDCSLQRTPLTDDDLVNITGGVNPQSGPAGNIGQTHTLSRGDAFEHSSGFICVVTVSGSYLTGNNVPTEKFTAGNPVVSGQGIYFEAPVDDLFNTNLFTPIPSYPNF